MPSEPNEKAWKCAGCGVPSPDRIRACDCPTAVLWQEEAETVTKVDPDINERFVRFVLGKTLKGSDNQSKEG
jgi:hypothetical protein